MKFGFSTLGCPSWNFKEIISSAKDLGYDGVEIRGISEEMYAPSIKYFNDDRINDTIKYLNQLHIEIPILSSNAEIALYEKKEQSYNEAIEYINLASRLNVSYVRLLCTNSAAPNGGDIELAKETYNKILNYAQDKNVIPLIETNGIFSNTVVLKEFMESIELKNKGVLWDIHHPYRYNDEKIDSTIKNIGMYIKYVHVKDSIMINNNVSYRMLGYGDIPIKEAILMLKNIGYNGYLTLEWVKRWNKNLEEPGVALCHYINYIKNL